MSTTMSKRPSLEISGITMVYVTASLAGLSLSLGIFGLPGVRWSEVLPVPPVVAGVAGTLLFGGLFFVAMSLQRLRAWARSVILGVQGLVGIAFPILFDPQPFLPRVDWEFVVLARFVCVLASAGIVHHLAFGGGRDLFGGKDVPALAGDCYCPLCLDRFESTVEFCPTCGVPALQSYVAEGGATFAVPVSEDGGDAEPPATSSEEAGEEVS